MKVMEFLGWLFALVMVVMLVLLIRHGVFISKDNAQIRCDQRNGDWIAYEWSSDKCEYEPDLNLNMKKEW